MSGTGYILKISRHGDIRRESFNPSDCLKLLQRAVGGWIERVDIPAFIRDGLDCDCYVNEEGMFDPDPVMNIAVSMMAGRCIVGDAVLVMTNGRGESRGIPERLCRELVKFAKRRFAMGVLMYMKPAPTRATGGDNEERQA